MVMKTLPIILLISTAVAGVVQAQTPNNELRVRVLTNTGSPIEGALVALVDQENKVVAEGLTPLSGTRVLSATPGSYRVRVRRIGFTPFISDVVSIPYIGTFSLRVRSDPISLKRVVVSADSVCKQPANAASTLAVVWEEITKALEASQLALDDFAGLAQGRVYRKETGRQGEVYVNQSRTFFVKNRRPFSSVDPEVLAKKGYMRGNEYRGWEFFGPDEAVLLSRGFATTHCFTVVRDTARTGQIGVGFRPVPRRRVSDIAGVLWVDEGSSELREMNFRYVNVKLPDEITRGGYTKFRRTPSGSWLVDEWKISMPLLAQRHISARSMRNEELVQVGTAEVGGSIIIPGQER